MTGGASVLVDLPTSIGRHVAEEFGVLVDGESENMTGSREWTSEVEFGKMRNIFLPVRSSNDDREGALAFTQKRAPRWTAT